MKSYCIIYFVHRNDVTSVKVIESHNHVKPELDEIT